MDFTKIKSASILTLAIELLSETSIIKFTKKCKVQPSRHINRFTSGSHLNQQLIRISK